MLFYAIFDRFPVTPGAFLVVPHEHVESIFKLPHKYYAALFTTMEVALEGVNRINLEEIYTRFCDNPLNDSSLNLSHQALEHPNLKKTMTEFNWGANEGTSAGRTVDHLHIHVYPRCTGDWPDPRGGIRHMFSGKGNYITP